MCHLLYLMFRCDGDVMENLDFGRFLGHLNTPVVRHRHATQGMARAETDGTINSHQQKHNVSHGRYAHTNKDLSQADYP